MDPHQVVEFTLSFAHDHSWAATALLAVGTLSIARIAFQTFSVLLQTFVIPGTSLKRFGAKNGAWAVVTGSTTGIGKEFAFQLAKAGFNVFLVSRDEEVLRSVAFEISEKYPGVSTKTHAIDFAKADEAAYTSLTAALDGLDAGVLVNNVGKSHIMPAYFIDTPKDEIVDIPAININATLRVTYAILPGMVQRKRGLILNIGSFAGAIPSAMLATYSGTKAFLATFSSALAEEVKKDHIIVEHLNTYFVVSKLSKIRRSSATVPEPPAYVRSVLSKVGLSCGAAYSGRPGTSTPYWSHSLMDWAITLFGVRNLAIPFTHNMHRDIRRRALKKMEREMKAQ